ETFHGDYSVASDLWAAGIMLHELLSGAFPHPNADLQSILNAVTSDKALLLSDKIPDSLQDFLHRALAKPPDARFATAAEMAAALTAPLLARPAHFENPASKRHNPITNDS